MTPRAVSRRNLLFGPLLTDPRPSRALTRHHPIAVPTLPRLEATPPSQVGRIVARVDIELCVPFCSACAEHCPVPGALRLEAGRVTISTSLCNGCGACSAVCPSPGSPIELGPPHAVGHQP